MNRVLSRYITLFISHALSTLSYLLLANHIYAQVIQGFCFQTEEVSYNCIHIHVPYLVTVVDKLNRFISYKVTCSV